MMACSGHAANVTLENSMTVTAANLKAIRDKRGTGRMVIAVSVSSRFGPEVGMTAGRAIKSDAPRIK